MGEHLAGRPPFDRPTAGQRIPELRLLRVGGEIRVVRQPPGPSLTRQGREYRDIVVRVAVDRLPDHRDRCQQLQTRHYLGELLRPEQRAARRTRRYSAVGECAWREW